MARIGNDAGWHLHFTTLDAGQPRDVLSVGAGDYDAEIAASLPVGLAGGAYRFCIEGITNSDYQTLHALWSKSPQPTLLVDLYLYWRDTSFGPGYLASLAGLTGTLDALGGLPPKEALVAKLVVTGLSRRVGRRRYEAVIEARETVYDTLARRLPRPPTPANDPITAATEVARVLNIEVVEQRPLDAATPAGAVPPTPVKAGTTGLRALADLASAMEATFGRAGRGVYLIRDGVLQVGPGRPIPFEGGTPLFLDDSEGLAHVETSGSTVGDRFDDPDAEEGGASAPSRLHYTLTLKGHPELKPGSCVAFLDPLEGQTTTPSSVVDALAGLGTALLGGGALSGTIVSLYISGVTHRLSRTEGFVTTVTGVAYLPGQEWDKPATTRASDAGTDPVAAGEDAVASAIRDIVRDSRPELLGIAEVRAQTTHGTDEPPGQTVDVWFGLAPPDGMAFRARRLAIDRDRRSRMTGVPYTTPFAWGKCGLVVPRYPGTRVVVGHGQGEADDPIEIGAMWESGHGPESLPGDWWLILPADVDSAKRSSLDDSETPQEPTGTATNDLIDADGGRIIEVGRLTVRVQPTKLAQAGTRPQPPQDDAQHVTIEHENGSRIVISDNGDITIEAKGNLTLKADKALNIDADEIKVTVNKTMDVS